MDMSREAVVAGEGSHPAVFVVGSDTGPTGLEMYNNGDGTWSKITQIPAGTYAYKFRNGKHSIWTGGWEEGPEECGHGKWNQRQITVNTHHHLQTPMVCFGCCGKYSSTSKYQINLREL